VRYHRHTAGVQSVAFGPDGTLFALTSRGGEIWAYPAGGGERVLAVRATSTHPLEGWLDVSPDGRWLAVTGLQDPTLFRVGSLTPDALAASQLARCATLPGWGTHRYHTLHFYGRTCFTGDSKHWVGRTHHSLAGIRQRFRSWRLSDLARSEYTGFLVEPSYQTIAAEPGTSCVVVEGWSSEHKACAFWRGDVATPDVPAGEPVGTVEHCNGFRIGGDGRYYVSYHREILVYSPGPSGFRLDLTIPMPHFKSTPELSLSADGRRFVAHCFLHKLVCAADTRTGDVSGPWDWNIGKVNAAAIAPDGLTAAAGGTSKKLVVWDLDD
jgi:WD40 repeat protein